MDDVLPVLLVVDDDPAQRRLLRVGLEPRGFRVLEAANGREGADMVRRLAPDVALLDLRMPVLDGLGFLAEVDVRALGLPVVVVSGVDDVQEAARAFKLGAVDYLPKPLTSFDLVEQAVRGALTRRDLTRQARQAEGRYHTLVENVPMTVFLMDTKRALLFANRHLKTLFGQEPAEVLRQPGWLVERAHPQDREKLRRLLDATLARQDEPRSSECRFSRTDGALAYCLIKVIPLGQACGPEPQVEGVILDISDRVALEKFLVQREKLKTLGSIAKGLAHEIRNPLTSIGGFARRLREKHPEAHEAEIILSEALRLEELLARTLGYLTPVKIKAETCEVATTVREALAVLACEADARGVTVRLELGSQQAQVREDPELLAQVLTSLAREMLARAPRGGELSVTAAPSERHVTLVLEASNGEDRQGETERRSGTDRRNGMERQGGTKDRDATEEPLPFDQSEAESGLPFARRMLGLMGASLELAVEGGRTRATVRLPRRRERL